LNRLRDAANSLINRYTSHPNIDPQRLAERWKDYKVVIVEDRINVVPRAEKETTTGSFPVIVGEAEDVLAVVKADNLEVIRAFALLLSQRVLNGKVRIIGPINTTNAFLETEFDITFVEENQESRLMF
jgi:hypothetical protein